jgi:hypothetical protein
MNLNYGLAQAMRRGQDVRTLGTATGRGCAAGQQNTSYRYFN